MSWLIIQGPLPCRLTAATLLFPPNTLSLRRAVCCRFGSTLMCVMWCKAPSKHERWWAGWLQACWRRTHAPVEQTQQQGW